MPLRSPNKVCIPDTVASCVTSKRILAPLTNHHESISSPLRCDSHSHRCVRPCLSSRLLAQHVHRRLPPPQRRHVFHLKKRWRCKYTGDKATSESLEAISKLVDEYLPQIKAASKDATVNRLVCGACLDFKLMTTVRHESC